MRASQLHSGVPDEAAGFAEEPVAKADQRKLKIAIIVSHPIQYYAPLYQRLARRDDLEIKVFFTWHSGEAAVNDHGFRRRVAWDIPLTEGYEFELVPNASADPGTHHFLGLRNPSLIARVLAWKPDLVHITGWAWYANLQALRSFAKQGIRTLFRGDSHLLDPVPDGPEWWIKRAALQHVYKWPTGFLVVGSANRAYYEEFGVNPEKLFLCPHSIDVARFAKPAADFEHQARQWKKLLGISDDHPVLLFAGKFERKKRPLELMRAVQALRDTGCVLVMVGNGELEQQICEIAAAAPQCFRILPFQNQSRMPVVYRLGDLFVLPSAYGETWGLAVNEAMACGRPVLVSDRVGCARDAVTPSCGSVFAGGNPENLQRSLAELMADRARLWEMGRAATASSWNFDIAVTEKTLVEAVRQVCAS